MQTIASNVVASTIWFDLDNSPHVPLFLPIIRHYKRRGVKVIVTARDHSQTVELLAKALRRDEYEVIGRHHGASKPAKVFGALVRTISLARYIRRIGRPCVAVSHGSRSMVLAARLLRVPVISMYDYEHTETFIFNRLSDRVLVPERISDDILNEIGLSTGKRVKFDGIKEELYVRDFEADPEFEVKLTEAIGCAVPQDAVRILLRPPATSANYHDPQSDAVFEALLKSLATVSANRCFTVIVPRTTDQTAEIDRRLEELNLAGSRFAILTEAVNGLDLISFSDLVISGGGTMNREAVLMGVPVYSIFQGRQGELDRSMESSGEIVFIRSEADLRKIAFRKRERGPGRRENALTGRVEQSVIENIDCYLPRPKAEDDVSEIPEV